MAGDRHPDALFAVPPGRFVPERNALVARLRDRGDTAKAAEVAKLRRPSAAVWAINQAAREDRPAVDRFVEAVDRLAQAQLAAPEAVAEAARRQRAVRDELLARATSALQRAGLRASPTTVERIGTTLLGAAADRRTRADLRAGRLTSEQSAPGFDAVTRVAPGGARTARRAAQARDAAAHRRETEARAREARRVARAEAEEWARRAQELEREAQMHRRAAEQAAEAARRARRRAAD